MEKLNMCRILFFVYVVALGLPSVAVGQSDDNVESPEQFYHNLPPEEKKRVREQSLNEFLDVDMFFDVIATRRFGYVADNQMAGKFGNRKLRQTIDYFKEKNATGVCVRCLIGKQHFWVKFLSGKSFRGNCDTITGGQYNLLFDIELVPIGSDGQYRPEITYRTGVVGDELYNTRLIKEEAWAAFRQYMSEGLPVMQRDVFIDKCNERVVGGLLKLLGAEIPPISVTLRPVNACAYDSCIAEKLRIYYDDVEVPGVPAKFYGSFPKAKWASVKKGSGLQVSGAIKEWLPDSTAHPLQFKLDNSLQAGFSSKDSVKQFVVNGFREGDNVLRAVQHLEGDRGVDILAGQLNVAAYKEEKYKVTLVPLQGVAAPDAQTLQAALNDIYRQAIVSWEVSVDRSLEQYAGGIEMPDNLSSDRPYCATMEAVIKAFKEQAKPDRKTRYIFLVKGFATGSNTDMGYMPFANQYGFVKAPGLSDAQIARTVAHELGHGAFGLKHTFDPEYGVSDNPQITPALNLMGYNDQVHLAKFQWDIIHQHSGETAFDSTDAVMMKGNDAALVFIETEGVGHTCIGLYTTNGLEIYTYGRYLGSDIPSSGSLAPIGDGILVWYKTEVDVNAYINLHLNKGPSAKVYMVYLNNSSLIEQYLQTKWNDGKDLPENIMETINGVKTIIPNKYYGFGKAIGKYIITTNNCTTITVEALKIGGFDVMKEAINQPTPKDDFWAPSILETYLNYFKNNANKYRVYEITEQFKSK